MDEVELFFNCPNCGDDMPLEMVKTNVTAHEVLCCFKKTSFLYNEGWNTGGRVKYYRCHECLGVVKNSRGNPIRDWKGMVHWMEKHPKRENENEKPGLSCSWK